MQVLILGANGLVGFPVAQRLAEAGYNVTGVGRSVRSASIRCPGLRWVALDIARLKDWTAWATHLEGIAVVVNASGALQEGPRDDLKALQADSMRALFEACARVGVRHVIHISAAGVSAQAPTAFFRTKAEADAALMATALDWTILRPGLVIAAQASGGTAVVRALASFPVAAAIAGLGRPIQTVPAEEVAEAVLACIEGRVPSRACYDLVEERGRSLQEILLCFRRWLGYPPAARVRVPQWAVRVLFRLGDSAGRLGWRAPMRTTVLRQLELGVVGDTRPWTRASGRRIASLEETLSRRPSTLQDRWFARMWPLKPTIIIVLSLFWLASGLIALPQAGAAAAVLTRAGIDTLVANGLVIGGCLLDIALGLAILAQPTHRAAAFGMVLATVGYLSAATVVAPGLWLDPFGSLVKAVPAAFLALVVLAVAEER